MLSLSPEQSQLLRNAVEQAARREEVRVAVHNLYRAVQDAIDLRTPICQTSGRCCRFDEFGHKLFVTTMELAAFVSDVGSEIPSPDLTPGGCPFQQNKLCTVHAIRPFGCRIFFCDGTAQQWQQAQYARFHDELKRLHEQLRVPYFYVEWREALSALAGG